jgi:hypothetical protein
MEDRAELVKLLVASGAAVDARSKLGGTPLHTAARLGSLGTMAVLLDSGAAIDAAANEGETPLHLAAMLGRGAALELLVARGARIDAADAAGWTALHFAVLEGDSRAVELLLRLGASPDAPDRDRETALHKAAGRGHAEIVRLLLARGADAGAAEQRGAVPLVWSATVEVFELLRAPTLARLGDGFLQGLPPPVVAEVIASGADQFRSCHEGALRRDPNLFGKLALRFKLDDKGAVSRAEVSRADSTVYEPAFAACVVRGFKRLRFPAPFGGVFATTFPIDFEKRAPADSAPGGSGAQASNAREDFRPSEGERRLVRAGAIFSTFGALL